MRSRAARSCAGCRSRRREVVSTTTGIAVSRRSALISASTSRPSLRGRLRSSRIRSGSGHSGSRSCSSAWTPSGARAARCCALVVLERLAHEHDIAGVVLDEQDHDRVERGHATIVSESGGPGSVNQILVPPEYALSSQMRAAVVLDDLAAASRGRCRCPRSGRAVQPLEDHEDPLRVLGVDPDPVVGAIEQPVVPPAMGVDRDSGRRVGVELDAVGRSGSGTRSESIRGRRTAQAASRSRPRRRPPARAARGHSSPPR